MTNEPHIAGDGVPEVVLRYSVEELSAVAELFGMASFPGTCDHRLEEPRERQAARRALVARGTVVEGSDGAIAIDPAERSILGCVLRPGAVISVGHGQPGAVTSALIHMSRRLSVLHHQELDGIHRLAGFPTAALPRRIAALVHLSARDAVEGGAVAVTGPAVERLRAGSAGGDLGDLDRSVRRTSRVAVLRRDGERVSGGEVTWVDAGERGLLVLTQANGSASLAPTAAAGIVERLRLLLE